MTFAPQTAHATARKALVIGNADYDNGPLENPVNDARDMTAAVGRLGFDVIEKGNADKRELITATDVEFEAVHAGRLLGKMRAAGNRLNIVILDACRDNPFKRSFRSAEQGLAKMDAPHGPIIWHQQGDSRRQIGRVRRWLPVGAPLQQAPIPPGPQLRIPAGPAPRSLSPAE